MSDALQDLLPEALPPLPPNSCVLAVRPAADRAHTLLRLTYDVTHLEPDAQKLLVFAVTDALQQLEKGIKGMGKIEVASKLAHRERAKGNGTP